MGVPQEFLPNIKENAKLHSRPHHLLFAAQNLVLNVVVEEGVGYETDSGELIFALHQ